MLHFLSKFINKCHHASQKSVNGLWPPKGWEPLILVIGHYSPDVENTPRIVPEQGPLLSYLHM